jgi:hypothetical protein
VEACVREGKVQRWKKDAYQNRIVLFFFGCFVMSLSIAIIHYSTIPDCGWHERRRVGLRFPLQLQAWMRRKA